MKTKLVLRFHADQQRRHDDDDRVITLTLTQDGRFFRVSIEAACELLSKFTDTTVTVTWREES